MGNGDKVVDRRRPAGSDTKDDRLPQDRVDGGLAAPDQIDCSPTGANAERTSESVTDIITRLWPEMDAGMRYLQDH